MSGSIPHTIALSNSTAGDLDLAQKQFDVRSDEDTSISALHARNAPASSDLIVTLSEQAQQSNLEKQQQEELTQSRQQADDLAEHARLEQAWLEDQQMLDAYEKQTKTGEYVNITI